MTVRVIGFADLQATRQLASDLEKQAARELTGLIDPHAVHRKRPLTEHLAEWKASLVGKGCTKKYIDLVTDRAKKFCDGCGFVFWSDVSSAAAWRFVGKLRDDGKGTRTRNHFLRAIRQFTRWMPDEQRAPSDPLLGMKPETVTDETESGVFETEELLTLLAETEAGPDRRGMTGFERRLLYEVAASTGFRNSECRSLTWGDVDLESDPPTLRVTARRAKNRKTYEQPLTANLAALLTRHVTQRGKVDPEDLVFAKTPDGPLLAPMLYEDMHAAGIDGDDAAGRPRNFHSFRHTFGTGLARAGVTVKVAMTLMRHSDVNLTMRRYSHTLLPERQAGIDALPDLGPAPQRLPQRKTGTCDFRQNVDRNLSVNGPEFVRNSSHSIARKKSPVALAGETDTDAAHRGSPTKQGAKRTALHSVAPHCTDDSRQSPDRIETPKAGSETRMSCMLRLGRESLLVTTLFDLLPVHPTRS